LKEGLAKRFWAEQCSYSLL